MSIERHFHDFYAGFFGRNRFKTFVSLQSQVVKELFHVVFTITCARRFYKGFATLCTVVLLDLKQNVSGFIGKDVNQESNQGQFLPHCVVSCV